jgi:hypothetical protein
MLGSTGDRERRAPTGRLAGRPSCCGDPEGSHSDQVVGCRSHRKHPSDPRPAAMAHFPQPSARFTIANIGRNGWFSGTRCSGIK